MHASELYPARQSLHWKEGRERKGETKKNGYFLGNILVLTVEVLEEEEEVEERTLSTDLSRARSERGSVGGRTSGKWIEDRQDTPLLLHALNSPSPDVT